MSITGPIVEPVQRSKTFQSKKGFQAPKTFFCELHLGLRLADYKPQIVFSNMTVGMAERSCQEQSK